MFFFVRDSCHNLRPFCHPQMGFWVQQVSSDIIGSIRGKRWGTGCTWRGPHGRSGQQFSLRRHPKSMKINKFHWISLIFIGFHWFSLIFIDFHWFSLIFIDFHWFSMIFIGFLLILWPRQVLTRPLGGISASIDVQTHVPACS